MRFENGKHYMCIRNYTGTGSKDNPDWKRGRIYLGGFYDDCLINDSGNNVVMLDENGDYFRLATQDEIDGKVTLEDEPLTYKQMMADAELIYRHVAQDSPFCAAFEARKYIASKIDECVDRNEHLDILQWDEYKEYAPMTSAEYESRKALALTRYEEELRRIESEWINKGRHSPDYHKV